MPAIDDFVNKGTRADPATSGAAVTPSDTVELTNVSRSLWVGVTGNITVLMADGQTVLFSNMTVGWHPLRVRRVNATGTTATNITAVW